MVDQVNEAYGNLSSSENQRVYDEWLQDSNPLGNRSLAFLNTETEPAVAAGRKLVDTTTPSPPQCLSTASSPRHSPAASRDARNRSAREEGCEEGDERGRQGRRGGGEESHGSGKEGGAGMSRTNPGGERRGEMSAEDQDVNKTKAKGKGKGKK